MRGSLSPDAQVVQAQWATCSPASKMEVNPQAARQSAPPGFFSSAACTFLLLLFSRLYLASPGWLLQATVFLKSWMQRRPRLDLVTASVFRKDVLVLEIVTQISIEFDGEGALVGEICWTWWLDLRP